MSTAVNIFPIKVFSYKNQKDNWFTYIRQTTISFFGKMLYPRIHILPMPIHVYVSMLHSLAELMKEIKYLQAANTWISSTFCYW